MSEGGAAAAVALGVVRGAFGVKGWVRIAPYSADAEVLRLVKAWWLRGATVPGGSQQVQVSGLRQHSGSLLAKWDGCETPEAADGLRGAEVAVERERFPVLPAGEVYWVDLVGASVLNRSGVELGRVARVDSNGAHDLIEVIGGKVRCLIPLVDAYVDEVDTAGRTIRVDWEPDW